MAERNRQTVQFPSLGRRRVEANWNGGGVDCPEYLARLDDIGYDGFLTIKREVGDNPVTDIVKAVELLKTL